MDKLPPKFEPDFVPREKSRERAPREKGASRTPPARDPRSAGE